MHVKDEKHLQWNINGDYFWVLELDITLIFLFCLFVYSKTFYNGPTFLLYKGKQLWLKILNICVMFFCLVTCTHTHGVKRWILVSLEDDLKFFFSDVLMKMEKCETFKSWAFGTCICQKKLPILHEDRENGSEGQWFS